MMKIRQGITCILKWEYLTNYKKYAWLDFASHTIFFSLHDMQPGL